MKEKSKKYIISQTNILAKLIDDGKFILARKLINNLLIDYPNDVILNIQFSRLNTLEGKYEESLEILEKLDEDFIFTRKVALYIKLNKEKELYNLYQKYFSLDSKYYEENKNFERYKCLSIYLNKKYNKKFQINPNDLSYTESQIYSYDKIKALKHIKINHCMNPESGKSIFSNDINIEKLYDKVTANIKTRNDSQIEQNIIEVYTFEYPNCGHTNNINHNYLHVCTFLGSKDILTMYPTQKIKKREALQLEEPIKPKKRIRIKTGLERFNNKYSS